MKKKLCLSLILGCTATFSPAYAQDKEIEQYLDLSLEELFNIEVTSVSKRPEKFSQAASAIFVVTQDDIRRSGATTIPEALRMVPGMQVAQQQSHTWAVSARGFNEEFTNKLLVLVDGRTVYSPAFSGVHWETVDTIIDDIDRIEVIRGPGATLWGANAVNGVINIVTKSAEDTQGGLVKGGYGSQERGLLSGRFGGKIADKGHYRVFAKYVNRKELKRVDTGLGGMDDWDFRRVGFRADWENTKNNDITVQGDLYDGEKSDEYIIPTLTLPFTSTVQNNDQIRGGNVLTRWNQKQSDTSSTSLQFYFDLINRDQPTVEERRNIFDLDFQHVWTPHDRHDIVWGLGYRFMRDRLDDSAAFSFTPDNRTDNIWSAFIQDKIHLIPERVYLTLGTKLERNHYSGFEYQPSARLLWTPTDHQVIWSAVSRSVRTPSRVEHDFSVAFSGFPAGSFGPGTPAGFITGEGSRAFDSEEQISYELGYRVQPNKRWFVDATAFFNDYDDLRSLQSAATFIRSAPGVADHLAIPIVVMNNSSGESFGFELSTTWDVSDRWRLLASYSFIDIDLEVDDPTVDLLTAIELPNHAENQFNLRSHLALPYDLEMNNSLYFVDNVRDTGIPSYIRFDTHIAWEPTDSLELSLVGRNLFDDRHPEITNNVSAPGREVSRSVYGQVAYRF